MEKRQSKGSKGDEMNDINAFSQSTNSNTHPIKNDFHLEGVDVKTALNKLCLDYESFKTILKIFDETYSQIIKEIKNELEKKSDEVVRKLLHTLEGAAANIRADGVQLATYELREAIKSREKNLKPLIDHLENQLKIVLKSIRSLNEHSKEKSNEQR